MLNLFLALISWVFLIIGILSMLTPIPGGVILISGGLTMLICNSPTARKCIRYTRTVSNRFDKLFLFLEKKIGRKINIIGTALEKTRPGATEDVN